MYKLDLPTDLREANKIENRRNREEQRKSRIFNSKIRQIGIDVLCLDQQIDEKKNRKKLQENSDALYAASLIRADKISILMEKRQQEDLKELDQILNEFRNLHQKPEQRREYDLYDPNGLKKDKPARVCDDDPRCGISSIQKFDGEDLNNKNRIAVQKDQMKKCLEIQINQRNNTANALKQSERLYDLKRMELDKRTCDLMNAEEECKRAINVAMSNYNEALSNENMAKERLKLQQEDDDKKMHIINALTSDLLSENPDQSKSALGAQRIIPDRYKGMSKDQLDKIHEMVKTQIKDKNLKEKQEKEINDMFDKQRIAQARSALLIENELLRRKNILDKKNAEENLKLSKNHRHMMDYINNELYTNQPTAEYFMQFNTCSR